MEADNDDFPDLDDPPYRLNDDNDLYVHLEDVLPAGRHFSWHLYQGRPLLSVVNQFKFLARFRVNLVFIYLFMIVRKNNENN